MLSTLARRAAAQGVHSMIVTGDRDILQVVDDHIRVLTSGQKFSDTIMYTPQSPWPSATACGLTKSSTIRR